MSLPARTCRICNTVHTIPWQAPAHLANVKISKAIWDEFGKGGPKDREEMKRYITLVNNQTRRSLKSTHRRASEVQKFKRHYDPLPALAYFLKRSQKDVQGMFISFTTHAINFIMNLYLCRNAKSAKLFISTSSTTVF